MRHPKRNLTQETGEMGSARTDATAAAHPLLGAARARRQLVMERLRHLVELETPTSDADASNHAADLLAARYLDLGATVQRHTVHQGTHLVADLPGTGALATRAPVLLLGHSDTVWAIGTLAEMPWSVDGDIARGPGSQDMKSGLVIIETALELTESAPDRRPVRVLVGCDEEIGSPTIGPFLATALEGVACVLGFEAPHPDGALKSGRWGSTRLRVEVRGRAAHAALDPEKGISAIDELVDQLVSVRHLVASLDEGSVLLNVGAIEGGRQANVVAHAASALLGLRFRTPDAESAVLGALASLTPYREGASITTTVVSQRPAWSGETEAAQSLVMALAEVGKRLGLTVTARSARGAADTNQTGALGVPTIDGLGPVGAGAHARDEHASLSSMTERAALVAAFLTAPEIPL
jgi:glutamate carboxypeptidase